MMNLFGRGKSLVMELQKEGIKRRLAF